MEVWPEKHWGIFSLMGSHGRRHLQGTGRRTSPGRISWALLFLCREEIWLNQWFWWLGIETSSIPVCWEEHWGKLVGSMLWWFCEEADGSGFVFMSLKWKGKNKSQQTKLLCSECCVRELSSFFWATRHLALCPKQENPTKQRVGQGIGQPLEDSLGHQCRAFTLLLLSVRCNEVSWDVHWRLSWFHCCQCFVGASLFPPQNLGLLPFTGSKCKWVKLKMLNNIVS